MGADWAALLADPRSLRDRDWFIAEGRLVFRRVVASLGASAVIEVLVTPAAVRALPLDGISGDRVVVRTPAEMEALTGFNFHRGVLELVRRPGIPDAAALVAAVTGQGVESRAGGRKGTRAAADDDTDRSVLVVAEHLVDVDNIGSCFRNARAFGAAAVLLDRRCPDPLYRKAIRTSLGTVLEVPWAEGPIDDLFDALALARVTTIGLTPGDASPSDSPSGSVRPLADICAALGAAEPVAIVVGNEGAGLSPGTLQRCTWLGRIPMAEGADSLNVATALAIALYEARMGGRRGGASAIEPFGNPGAGSST